MNRIIRMLVLPIAVSLLVITSCKKDDEEPAGGGTALTAEQMIAGNDWVLVSVVTTEATDCNDDGTFQTELVPDCYDTCDLDDFLDLNTDLTYTWNEGATLCEPGNDQVYEMGTWSLNNNASLLTLIENNGFSYGLVIQSITATELVIVDTFENNGETVTITETYN